MQKVLFGAAILAWAFGVGLPETGIPDYKPTAVISPERPIGNLWMDTLTLTANYSECGEFGGHREMIKVYFGSKERIQARRSDWKSLPFTATWFLDSARCSQPNRKFFLANQRLLNVEDEAAIVQYTQMLLAYNLKEEGNSISNGGNRYSIKRTNKDHLQVEFYDSKHTWDGFKSLREKLFKK